MINSFQLLNQFDEQISSNDLTALQRKVLLSQYADLLLSQLQAGDSIEGVIAKTADNKYILQVKPNLSIPVQMMDQLELGQNMTFIVQGKENGKLYLQSSSTAEGKEISLVQKTAEELNLPKNMQMQEVIDAFVQKHLPLAKEMLQKVYQLSKEYEMPSKLIANLIDHKQPILLEEMNNIAALRENGMTHIAEDVKYVLQSLNQTEDLFNIFNVLKEQIPNEKLSRLVSTTLYDTVNQLPEHDSSIKQLSAEAEAILSESAGTTPEEAASSGGANDEWLKLLNHAAQLPDKSYKHILRQVIGAAYDEAVMFHLGQMKSDFGESEKLFSTYNTLSKILKTLEHADLSKDEKDYINYIKEPLNVLGKFNVQAEYFVFPMLSENKQTQGEIYFFKPKKASKKNKDHLYIVVALDLPHINNIEIHINKQDKNILIHMNVENESIQKHFAQYLPELGEQIQNLGFSVSKTTWGLFTQKNMRRLTQNDGVEPSLHHMDFKV